MTTERSNVAPLQRQQPRAERDKTVAGVDATAGGRNEPIQMSEPDRVCRDDSLANAVGLCVDKIEGRATCQYRRGNLQLRRSWRRRDAVPQPDLERVTKIRDEQPVVVEPAGRQRDPFGVR